MAQALTLLDDEKSKRLEFKFAELMQLVDKESKINFELHKKDWTLAIQDNGTWFRVTVTCVSYYNEPWCVRIGLVYKSQIVVTGTKVRENKEEINTFKMDYFWQVSAVQAFEHWEEELRLFVEIKRKEDEEIQMRNAGIRKLQSDYEDMLLSGQNSDVILQVKDKKFNCHRCILAARSPVFHAMFDHDMKEKISGVVIIEDAEPAVFQEFLLYLYSGSGKYLSSENVIDLYYLGDKYNVKQLVDICMWNINKTKPLTDFFSELSQLRDDTELPDELIQFFSQRKQEISVSEMWQTLLQTNKRTCYKLMLKSDILN